MACFCVDPNPETCALCQADLALASKTCPTCEAHGVRTAMVKVTGKVWICPVQRANDWPVTRERRAAIKADAYAIDPACGF